MRSLERFPAQSVSLLEYEDSEGFMMLSTLNLENLQCIPAIYSGSKGKLITLSDNVTVADNAAAALIKWDAEPSMKDASWMSRLLGGR